MTVFDGFEHPETKITTVRTIQKSVHVELFIANLLRLLILVKSNALAKLRAHWANGGWSVSFSWLLASPKDYVYAIRWQ
jgi:hypothetical protein